MTKKTFDKLQPNYKLTTKAFCNTTKKKTLN